MEETEHMSISDFHDVRDRRDIVRAPKGNGRFKRIINKIFNKNGNE